MNFKKFSLLLPFVFFNLKAFSAPLVTESVDNLSESESEVEIVNVDLNGEDVKVEDIFSEDENLPTDSLNVSIEEKECLTDECLKTSKKISSYMDTSVDPCDDFYQYACGGWVREMSTKNVDYNEETYTTLQQLQHEINVNLNEMLQGEYKVNNNLSKEEQEYDEKLFNKVKKAFNICMNYDANSDSENKEIKKFIAQLKLSENKDNLKDPKNLTKVFLELVKKGIDPYVTLSLSYNKLLNENPFIMFTTSTDAYSYPLLLIYSEMFPSLSSIPSLVNESIKKIVNILYDKQEADLVADSIINGVQKLNEILTEQYSSISTNIETLTIESMNEKYPFMDWDLYIKETLKFYGQDELLKNDILIYDSNSILLSKLNEYFNEVDVDTLIHLIEWNIIDSFVFTDIVSKEISSSLKETTSVINDTVQNAMNGNAQTDFYMNSNISKNLLNNVKLLNSIDKYNDELNKVEKYDTCIEYVEAAMPFSISKYFLERNFNDNVKSESEKMVENIKESMINRIPKMEWLDEETKQYAIEKVLKIKKKVAYPDDVLDVKKMYHNYERVEFNDYLSLMLSIKNQLTINMYKNSVPYDWSMSLFNVAASYSRFTNTMNFPAAILFPPIYNSNGLDYLNYGGIGAIIGHELTHAFDNNGRLYDVDGQYYNWWTDNDAEEFEESAQCFVNQYNNITYYINNEPNQVDGVKTLGENLADNGGTARAYDAWQISISKNPEGASERNKKLPGFSNYTLDQLFYIGYAQLHCAIITNEAKSDAHARGNARVNGVLSNSVHFSKTFNCPSNSPMNPEHKCLIW